jgi:outer membrane lipoprotein LolB
MSRIIIILLAATLTACQSFTPAPPNETTLPASWSLIGKLGYRGEQSGSATINWQYFDNSNLINLSGPFGSYATEISGDASNLSIRIDDTLMTGPAELIMREQLGWSTPIDAWIYWLNGAPDPLTSVSDYQRTPSQISFVQHGTRVTLDRFRDVNGYILPHRIVCERNRERITLLVNRWNLEE